MSGGTEGGGERKGLSWGGGRREVGGGGRDELGDGGGGREKG